jgi:YD repeat-containing protein
MADREGAVRRVRLWAGFLIAAASAARAADPVIDNRGFAQNREMVSELPFEHVDPMTGNLLLTFTDLVLPGNAGFDLRIQRTYNSKIYSNYVGMNGVLTQAAIAEDSWAGLGWTLHFGRVHQFDATIPGPIIEMPDGSRHQTLPHLDKVSAHFMTREYWTYEKLGAGGGRLRMPNGLTYLFGNARGSSLCVTEISDPFGNRIVVNYPQLTAFTSPDIISSVEQRLSSGEVRLVTFTYDQDLPYLGNPADRRLSTSLASMTYEALGKPARTWIYSQKLLAAPKDVTYLTGVSPPVGPEWQFEYEESPLPADSNAPLGLKSVTTPAGARIEYAYAPTAFNYGSIAVYSPTLKTRTVSGPSVPSGAWDYSFASPGAALPITATITSPCGKTRYTTKPIGPLGAEDRWAIGVLAQKEVLTPTDTLLELEELTWLRSPLLSEHDDDDPHHQHPTYVPLLGERKVTRGGKTYRTIFTYDQQPYSKSRPNNFADYGRAEEIREVGESGATSRKTTRVFFYDASADPSFSSYIVDKPKSETVRAPEDGGQPFTNTFEYETSPDYQGFLKAQVVHGIRTEFTADSYAGERTGNVKTQKDANGNVTSYVYAWGRTREIKTPEFTITRAIDAEGRTASETRRGFTTTFEYDALGRVTKTTPPKGNATSTTYDNNTARKVTVTRGVSVVTTELDGLGRTLRTYNNLQDEVQTATSYDTCGRVSFQTYPFTGPLGQARGVTTTYDALGRVVQRREPGDVSGEDVVSYDYGPGLRITVTDENGNEAQQNWVAFGDPGEPRLASVKDALDKTTAYTYDTLGSLLKVTPPSGPERTFVYYAAGESNGKPGLLKSETHPESGTVTHTYDAAGNVKTRTDAAGTTTNEYDGNNRLSKVIRPANHVLNIDYDASDNRTLLESLQPGGVSVRSLFTYDGANRLIQRRDELKLKPPKLHLFTTNYGWDGNDHLDTLTYPSSTATQPRKAKYTYDAAGRILSVSNPGKNLRRSLRLSPDRSRPFLSNRQPADAVVRVHAPQPAEEHQRRSGGAKPGPASPVRLRAQRQRGVDRRRSQRVRPDFRLRRDRPSDLGHVAVIGLPGIVRL